MLGPTGNHLDALLTESKKIGRELTNAYYAEYRALREATFRALRTANSAVPPGGLLAATQKMLDRVLFIAFCEDRGLLPRDIVARAYEQANPFDPRPIWHNFIGLFRAVDAGSPALNVSKYNGGLFAEDPFLNSLNVPDAVCEGFRKLAEYEYGAADAGDGKLIDVEILGHIFEQSITDLEELQKATGAASTAAAEPTAVKEGPSKRKKEGAFYTPEFVTRYIVMETLGPVLKEKYSSYHADRRQTAPPALQKVLVDPTAFDVDELKKPQTAALVDFWSGWIEALETVTIVDPSCGSGAFLTEAFDQMFAAYAAAQRYLTLLQGATLFDARRTILTKNLFGVDLNAEAVEIARLSCWIKTAEVGKQLTTLDANIQQGNSVVAEPSPLEGWRKRFPHVFAAGGFDVVVGNPPYVRQEWLKEFKPHWQANFASYSSTADLFVYFYELGLKVLKPGGRLGFITSGGWVRGAYGEGLREYLVKNSGLESMIDFGEFQPFEDAEMIRPTILVASNRAPGGKMRLWKWLEAARPPENLQENTKTAPLMSTEHLGCDAWELESDEVITPAWM
ncbi:MAG: Eco57I restriction-modification methylase domain-containing protein [Planctomycetia bacterium]